MTKRATKKKIVKKTAKKKVTKTTKSKKQSLRASQAAQWSRCSGFLDLEKNENPIADRSRAEYGTAVHKVAEHFLEAAAAGAISGTDRKWPDVNYEILKNWWESYHTQFSAIDLLTLTSNDKEDFLDYVLFYYTCIQQDILYASIVEKQKSDSKQTFHLEFKMEYSNKLYELGGTGDCFYAIIDHIERVIQVTVYDLKLGQGVVEAENNLQLATYLHMFIKCLVAYSSELLAYSVDLTGCIIQPPLYRRPVAKFQYFPQFLDSLYTEPGKRKFTTGYHCSHCPHGDICPELKKKIKKYLNPKFLDQAFNRQNEWGKLLEIAKPIKKMVETVNKTASEFAFRGVEIPGHETAFKNGHRAWIQKASVNYIQSCTGLKKTDVVDPAKTKSPANVEKALKAAGKSLAVLEPLVHRPQIQYLRPIPPEIKVGKRAAKKAVKK
jgi:hypothetical protein